MSTTQDLLTQKLGFEEVTNYFAGSSVNRLSFLRNDHNFLNEAICHPTTAFLLLKDLDPLAKDNALVFISYADVQEIIGRPYSSSEEKMIQSFVPSSKQPPALIFLGVDESEEGLHYKKYQGRAYFALDNDLSEASSKALTDRQKEQGRDFRKVRVDLSLEPSDAAILAQARSLVDWNTRNRFCSGCGKATLSLNAGAKRHCANANCVTQNGLHNQAFPRTDPTVIMATVNSAGDRILLGRQKRWPPRFYSCLAGFVEPGESIEEAVRRETYEESGIQVGR